MTNQLKSAPAECPRCGRGKVESPYCWTWSCGSTEGPGVGFEQSDECHVAELEREIDRWKKAGLAVLAGLVPTPEKGYRSWDEFVHDGYKLREFIGINVEQVKRLDSLVGLLEKHARHDLPNGKTVLYASVTKWFILGDETETTYTTALGAIKVAMGWTAR